MTTRWNRSGSRSTTPGPATPTSSSSPTMTTADVYLVFFPDTVRSPSSIFPSFDASR